MFRKMPIILLLLLGFILIFGNYIPLTVKSTIFTISLVIKQILVFLLPLIIFSLLFKTVVHLAKKASVLILFILLAVCFSNYLSTMISYTIGNIVYTFDITMRPPHTDAALEPLWSFELPKLIANNKAMFAGLFLGFLFGLFKPAMGNKIAGKLDWAVGHFFKIFTYFIPLFVAGFIVKLVHDGVMQEIIRDYSVIFALIAISQFAYILFLYLLASRFHLSSFTHHVKNMLPAAITGFSTMSSAASMPLTIMGTSKNTENKDLAQAIIPATVNIHLIGDCFAIPILAFAVMKSFGVADPSLMNYIIFAFYFVLAKFSVAAIPGGGIIVMIPILEAYLGFNAEMVSLITALYILFDPVITSANVMGNGGFAMLFDKAMTFFGKKRKRAHVN